MPKGIGRASIGEIRVTIMDMQIATTKRFAAQVSIRELVRSAGKSMASESEKSTRRPEDGWEDYTQAGSTIETITTLKLSNRSVFIPRHANNRDNNCSDGRRERRRHTYK